MLKKVFNIYTELYFLIFFNTCYFSQYFSIYCSSFDQLGRLLLHVAHVIVYVLRIFLRNLLRIFSRTDLDAQLTRAYSRRALNTKKTHTPLQTSMALVQATGGNEFWILAYTKRKNSENFFYSKILITVSQNAGCSKFWILAYIKQKIYYPKIMITISQNDVRLKM